MVVYEEVTDWNWVLGSIFKHFPVKESLAICSFGWDNGIIFTKDQSLKEEISTRKFFAEVVKINFLVRVVHASFVCCSMDI